MSCSLGDVTARPHTAPTAADAESILVGLDPEQAEAVTITRGPLVVHAGAGSGKTRVISHRVAYAVATDSVDRRQVLVVTFTDKAAREMVSRLVSLGLPGVAARTFHAAALAQLRHFWPSRHDGAPAPDVLDSKIPIVGRLARGLPGGYRFTPARDLAEEIEWAKGRRLTPETYAAATANGTGVAGARSAAGPGGRTPPIAVELFTRLWADYERAKDRAGRLDFDDMLTQLIDLLETDPDAAETVRGRYGWFSVDEYQDTNPLQQRLLELWLGDRDDLCVVGDEDQTIYTFTGATSEYLTTFIERHSTARSVTLARNYRSSPEILSLANRLLAAEGRRKRLIATKPSGPAPVIRSCPDGAAELAFITTTIRALLDGGTPPDEIAVLVRMNAQIAPIEGALTKARIPFQVRGQRFFERREVRDALRILGRLPASARGRELVDAFEERLRADLGFEEDGAGGGSAAGGVDGAGGAEARERRASLALILEMARAAVAPLADPDAPTLVADFEARASQEAAGSTNGVNLLTLHRAKGLEWDAVLLPQLEEGTLPIRQAESDEELAEERRLLYVGLTRARHHLTLTWAERRIGAGERETARRVSRFVRALDHRAGAGTGAGTGAGAGPQRRVTLLPGAPVRTSAARDGSDGVLVAALREWRLARARADGVPAYVVAHDSLLAGIAEQRPESIAGLRRLKGMGPARLERYGEEILAVVAGAPSGPAPDRGR